MAKPTPTTYHLDEHEHHAYELVNDLLTADLRQAGELERIWRDSLRRAQNRYCDGMARILRERFVEVPNGSMVMGSRDEACKSITLTLPDPDPQPAEEPKPKAASKVKAKAKKKRRPRRARKPKAATNGTKPPK